MEKEQIERYLKSIIAGGATPGGYYVIPMDDEQYYNEAIRLGVLIEQIPHFNNVSGQTVWTSVAKWGKYEFWMVQKGHTQ